MTVAFVRQVGYESNVQLNPLRDKSELPTQTISDQVFGIIGRFQRGPINKAFKVDKSNVRSMLGSGEPMRVSQLNEGLVHVIEALDNGAYEAVVSRLVPASATIKWLAVKYTPAVEDVPESYSFTVSDTKPEPGTYLLAIKHLGCFNDGIKLKLHADSAYKMGVFQPVDVLTFAITDKDDVELYKFTGSLNQDAKDDFGEPNWLPDVVAKYTSMLEVECVTTGTIEPTAAAYGDDESGNAKWVDSGLKVCFDEGGFVYAATDYVAARNRLQFTPHNYFYLSSGGSQSVALLGHLAQLAFQTNTQLRFDVSGKLKPDEVIAFMEQVNATGQKEAHLLHAYWAPIKSRCPAGINSSEYIGVATLNIAMACARNAQKNDKGFAPKNYPIAGKDWPIGRQGMQQTYTCTPQELSKLAAAKVNVVCWEEYDTGGRYVFRDSITCAPVMNSHRKLIASVEMACHTDDAFTRFGKGALQKPMKVSVKMTNDFARNYFQGAQDADWIVPAQDPDMGGLAARWVIKPSEARPSEEMIVSYDVRYDGTNRVTSVTQTLRR